MELPCHSTDGSRHSFHGRASVVWDTHSQNGSHTITATADPGNAIVESNEGNNTGSRSVTVQGGKVR